MSSIYIGGSRHLQSDPIMWQVVQAVIQQGNYVHVGCQSGADHLAIDAAIMSERGASSLVVFAVAPSWRQAPEHVRFAVNCEARVSFRAGGLTAPLPARYLLRSIAAIQGCTLAIFASPGPGSLAVARECVRSGLPVYALGDLPAPIPSVAGRWAESSYMGYPCWQWTPAQLSFL